MVDRASVYPAGEIGTGSAVALRALPPATRFVVRVGPDARVALGTALGVVLPAAVCRAAHGCALAALWLGPDEWLVLGPDGYLPDTTGILASVVDVSHRQIGITVSGPKATEALRAFCPLDLAPAAFPVGMCTRTVFGKAEIVLWRTAPDAFHVEVWRSFAPYVVGCLDEARMEYAAA